MQQRVQGFSDGTGSGTQDVLMDLDSQAEELAEVDNSGRKLGFLACQMHCIGLWGV